MTTRYGLRRILPDELDPAILTVADGVRELLTQAVESSDRIAWTTLDVRVRELDMFGRVGLVVEVRIDSDDSDDGS